MRARRTKEDEIDLWCKSCKRGFQDKNSIAAHLVSKKHKKMLEELRAKERLERMRHGDDSSDDML